MENEETQTTLRDTIAAQVDALENASTDSADTTSTTAPTQPAATSVAGENPAAQTVEDKPGRTAGRLRDDQGRLLPGKAEGAPADVPPQVAEAAKPGAVASPPAVTPAAEQVQRPSSWKKEMWAEFDKLPPGVKAYVSQREAEFARGVSTYRQEVENARPVVEAMAPFMPLLQQHKIDPGTWIGNLGNAHKMLVMGSAQEKLGIFAKLAREYQIPLEGMFVRGQDGQVYLNTQLEQNVPAPQAAPPNYDAIIEQKFMQREVQQTTKQFMEAKDAAGNPAHPHFDTVRETMSQLLAAGIANDLDSAYDAALRLPQHSHLYEAQQQQRAADDEAKKAKELSERAGVARRNAVSVRSATPTGTGAAGASKGIRGALESAWDSHMPGRV